MSFSRLLSHRATFHINTGDTGETDGYNHTPTTRQPVENVPCRVDRVKKTRSTDEKGTDFIYEHSLFCLPSAGLTEETRVTDIRDRAGNVILEGEFTVHNITPVYRRVTLHHFEAVLKRV